MADTLLPWFGGISEFYHDPITGQEWNGTCTQAAFECCFASLENHYPSQARMATWARDMVAHGYSQTNGASTLAAIAKYARALAVKTPLEWDFGAMGDWHTVLLENAGIHPILLQVANGQALVDAETGSCDEAGLHYHAIAVAGKKATGYICTDSDNPQVGPRYQIYTYETLAAAQPCGLLMMQV